VRAKRGWQSGEKIAGGICKGPHRKNRGVGATKETSVYRANRGTGSLLESCELKLLSAKCQDARMGLRPEKAGGNQPAKREGRIEAGDLERGEWRCSNSAHAWPATSWFGYRTNSAEECPKEVRMCYPG